MGVNYKFIHTGQHYDYGMSVKFIEEFGLRKPDYNIVLSSLETQHHDFVLVTLRRSETVDNPQTINHLHLLSHCYGYFPHPYPHREPFPIRLL
jgi:UDP-N-acetylglucosamine 2-epimerase